ncbi:hypothetical protein FB99_10640 [Pantoea agglomerans]|nr:hypothetical protein FB99_10640 [Pantoea agglomerans]
MAEAAADKLILCCFAALFCQPLRFMAAPLSEKMIKQSDERYFFCSTDTF